jgi:hypothetical protein
MRYRIDFWYLRHICHFVIDGIRLPIHDDAAIYAELYRRHCECRSGATPLTHKRRRQYNATNRAWETPAQARYADTTRQRLKFSSRYLLSELPMNHFISSTAYNAFRHCHHYVFPALTSWWWKCSYRSNADDAAVEMGLWNSTALTLAV